MAKTLDVHRWSWDYVAPAGKSVTILIDDIRSLEEISIHNGGLIEFKVVKIIFKNGQAMLVRDELDALKGQINGSDHRPEL